jgi:6-phosphogluconolactonase
VNVLVACEGDAESTGGLLAMPSTPGGGFVSPTAVPSGGLACVVRHPFLPVAYSVGGRERGELHTWSTARGIQLLGTQTTGGAQPCHLAVHPTGSALIVVNYSSGTLLALGLDANGVPADGGVSVPLEGTGPVRGRQDSAHPHQALFVSGGNLVLVPDLGADLLRSFSVNLRNVSLTPGHASPMPAGTGPRHAVYTRDGTVVVTGELSQTVVAGRLDTSTGRVDCWKAVPSTGRNPTEPNYPGDVIAHPDAAVVYVANRGADTVAVLGIEDDELVFIEEVAAGVRWPQHLASLDGALLIAGRDSSLVVALEMTGPSGRLGPPRPLARVPRPAWVAPEHKRVGSDTPAVWAPRRQSPF